MTIAQMATVAALAIGVAIPYCYEHFVINKQRRPPLIYSMRNLTDDQRKRKHIVSPETQKDGLRVLLDFHSDLNLSEEDVEGFHPVVIFPEIRLVESGELVKLPYYRVKDLRTAASTDDSNQETLFETDPLYAYAVGKYDEVRSNLYDSAMFQDDTKAIDGYSGARIVHIGLDLYAPVKTPVFAFSDGKVLHAGYNPAEGDYGNVIVIEHSVGRKSNGGKSTAKLWALYGHLDARSIIGKKAGKRIRRGQVIGWMGNVTENGGWPQIHTHLQLSKSPPKTHDMPGVVSLADREKALRDYPDPRIVVGMLY